MSWSLNTTGTQQAVVNFIEKATVGNNAQGILVKQFLLQELAYPRCNGNIIQVEAFGHSHDGKHGAMTIKITELTVDGVQISTEQPDHLPGNAPTV